MTQAVNIGSIPEWTLGWRLQRALAQSGLKSEEIADRLGVSRGTVSRWMNDKGAAPKTAFISQWALATGVPAVWLVSGEASSPNGPDGGTADGDVMCYKLNVTALHPASGTILPAETAA